MKYILMVLLLGACAFTVATGVEEEDIHGYHEYKLVDKDYLKKYNDILVLFKNVQQPTRYKYHVDIAKEYSIVSNVAGYSNSDAVKEFLQYYHQGLLPKDEIFSVFYDRHLKQAVALFKVLYYAKDFDTFYKTAVWARYYLNHGLFLYAFSVALIHRHDTYSMILPPIYEIYPYYFFNTEVIQKVQIYKQLSAPGLQQHEHVVQANDSGWYLNVHPEQSLSYFTEDIGINAYYYYYNLYRPFWMNNQEFDINSYYRGEEFYYFHQQLIARYYLERLSNNFGEIGTFDYNGAFETGYYPSLRYPNGLEFPQRSNWVYFFTNYYNHGRSYSFKGQYPYSYYKVVDYERRIRDAIDLGYVYTEDGKQLNLFEPNGFNLLGNIIESNPYSPNTRFYGYLQIFARHLLGYSYQPLHEYKLVPSALEHFETSLRDPAFWKLFKRLMSYFQKYKNYVPHYTYDELAYPGVKIEKVEVSQLATYFENFKIDMSYAAFLNDNEWGNYNFVAHAYQNRLNHKPFTYKISVISDKATEAVVRLFIGPKYDEYGRLLNINENRINFVEFDKFQCDLKTGKNLIKRNSRQILYASDRTSYKELYKAVLAGESGSEEFTTHGSEVYYAFPNRFLLPKGKKGGQTYQFYVIVSPYKAPSLYRQEQQEQGQQKQIYAKLHDSEEYDYFKYPMVGLGVQYLDHYSLGYPFDRTIDEYTFNVSNSYFHDVVIYHQHKDTD